LTSFAELGLSNETLRAVSERGYTQATPIQAEAIPYVLQMRDLIGLAQTGTGKTASFTLPMIEILSRGRARSRMPRSLVLTPTRELASQVAENFDVYGKYHRLAKALLVGGESMIEQKKILERGVDVLIATPGRLMDLFERGQILMTDIKILVIDEADRMLDMGFIPDIEKIVSRLPASRQTLLFSATMPPEIQKLTDRFLKNPAKVSVARPATTAETIDAKFLKVSSDRKRAALRDLMLREDVKNAFVFCNRKRDVDMLGKWLKDKGLSAAPLHGDMVQSKRTETLQAFKNGEVLFLVCSDVAARGLDVSAVSHVFNYDVPINPDDYVHRIGRTGRAGQLGKAWTLWSEDDVKLVDAIEKRIGQKIVSEEAAVPAAAREETDKPRASRNERPRTERPRIPERRPPVVAKSSPETAAIGFEDDDIPAFLRR
jgi:superfamily II DNA/RNA helicase